MQCRNIKNYCPQLWEQVTFCSIMFFNLVGFAPLEFDFLQLLLRNRSSYPHQPAVQDSLSLCSPLVIFKKGSSLRKATEERTDCIAVWLFFAGNFPQPTGLETTIVGNVHPSSINAYPFEGRRGAGADPRWHWARGGVHLEKVASLSQADT